MTQEAFINTAANPQQWAHAAVVGDRAISDGRGNFHGIEKLNAGGRFVPPELVGCCRVSADGTGEAHVFDYLALQAIDAGMDRQPQDGVYGVSWFKRIP